MMAEQISKETETYKTKQDSNIVQRVIYTIFGLITAVLAFRLIFRILGANPENGFVRSIYALTQPLVGIFEGILSQTAIGGSESAATFEPATVIAMVVVALIAWVVLQLITPRSGNRIEKTEYTKQNKSEE